MDVRENVSFGLRMRGLPIDQAEARVREVLELVDMGAFAEREVTNLSGGEQQRVALARALAPEPRLLMLDEPLASLDRALRERLMNELHRILKDINQTAIYVTHDQEEAFALADRVAIMRAGRFLRVDEPQEIYRRPETLFLARFLGMKNILRGEGFSADGRAMARTALGEIPIPDVGAAAVHVLLRPDAAEIEGEGEVKLEGKVLERSFRGGTYRAVVEVDGQELSFDFPSRTRVPEAGEPVKMTLDPGEGVQLLEEG
jgi:ABC-type Fe3+/spermidine/putrescine transport system ATPase subunit